MFSFFVLISGGANDPYVKLSFGSTWKEQTEKIDNSGASAAWSFKHTDMKLLPFLSIQSIKEKLLLEVYDWNQVTAHGLIGVGEIDFTSLVYDENDDDVVITAVLKNKVGVVTGSATVSFIQISTLVRHNTVWSPACSVQVKRIMLTDLKHVECVGFGENDPYVKLSLGGSSFQAETPRIDEAGNTAEWIIC